MKSVRIYCLILSSWIIQIIAPIPASAYDWIPTDTDPRSLSMGGAWLATGRGSGLASGNPALYAWQRHHLFSVAPVVTADRIRNEDVSTGDVTKNTPSAVLNLHHLGVVIPTVSRDHPDTTGAIGIQYQPMFEPGYAESREYVSGGPHSGSLGLGVRVYKGVSVGAGARLTFGSEKSTSSDVSTDYRDYLFTLGMAIPFEQVPLRLGLVCHLPHTYSINDGVTEMHFPVSWGVGLGWTPAPGILISNDIKYHLSRGKKIYTHDGKYSQPLVEDDTNVWEYRVGIELVRSIKKFDIAFRSGMCLLPTYLSEAYVETPYLTVDLQRDKYELGWSCGVGFSTERSSFDVTYYERISSTDAKVAISFPELGLYESVHEIQDIHSFVILVGLTQRISFLK